MFVQSKKMYACRKIDCKNPANGNYSCCSIACRNQVPTCDITNCKNATEPGFYKGMPVYSEKCYNHGGRIVYDGEIQETAIREKNLYVLTKSWKLAK